jgi:hypothetical protein
MVPWCFPAHCTPNLAFYDFCLSPCVKDQLKDCHCEDAEEDQVTLKIVSGAHASRNVSTSSTDAGKSV